MSRIKKTSAPARRGRSKPRTAAGPSPDGEQAAPHDLSVHESALSDAWEFRSGKLDGKNIPKAQLKGALFFLTCHGHFIVTLGDRVLWKGKTQPQPAEGPHALDILHTDGEYKGSVFRAIYRVEGDNHYLCAAPPGAERPVEFESHPGTGHMLQVWQRCGHEW